MKLRFLRPARQEPGDAIRYYNAQSAGLGDAFRNGSWATLQRAREFPLAWQALGGAIRWCQMQRFPYGVVYEPAAAEMIVIAIAHLHREPGYWRKRAASVSFAADLILGYANGSHIRASAPTPSGREVNVTPPPCASAI